MNVSNERTLHDLLLQWGWRPPAGAATHKIDSTDTTAVATDYYWNEDMSTCPISTKVQLLGKGGVAMYGIYNGHNDFWVAWAPLPKRRKPGGSDG